MTDSWVPNQKTGKVTANVVELNKDNHGVSWKCGLDNVRGSVIRPEDLAILAAPKTGACFTFWMEGKKMFLAELRAGQTSEPKNINERFERCKVIVHG